jgi:hypothetical protein
MVDGRVLEEGIAGLESIEYETKVTSNTRRAGLFDNGKDPRLGIIISVCTDTQVDFLRKIVRLESGGQLEDATVNPPMSRQLSGVSERRACQGVPGGLDSNFLSHERGVMNAAKMIRGYDSYLLAWATSV